MSKDTLFLCDIFTKLCMFTMSLGSKYMAQKFSKYPILFTMITMHLNGHGHLLYLCEYYSANGGLQKVLTINQSPNKIHDIMTPERPPALYGSWSGREPFMEFRHFHVTVPEPLSHDHISTQGLPLLSLDNIIVVVPPLFLADVVALLVTLDDAAADFFC